MSTLSIYYYLLSAAKDFMSNNHWWKDSPSSSVTLGREMCAKSQRIGLTLQPTLNIPRTPSQEVLIVLDLSSLWSMCWKQTCAKSALIPLSTSQAELQEVQG